MAVPEDIRAVPRPVNTIVEDGGRDIPKRYAVWQRASSRYVPGGNPQPRNVKINDLSAFSYKTRIKGCREVSVLYAYDIELMEPVCAEVFPGNSIDASSYPAIWRSYG